jgi:hypothetical protein
VEGVSHTPQKSGRRHAHHDAPPPGRPISRCEDMPKTTLPPRPGDSRCEDMPKTTPPPPLGPTGPLTGPAVKTCPRRRPLPLGPTGPLTGPAVGKRLSPHVRIPVITRISTCQHNIPRLPLFVPRLPLFVPRAPWLILTFTFAFTFTLAFTFTEAAAFCAAPSQVPPLVARGCLGRLSAHVSCSPCLWSMCTGQWPPAG